jgi:TP901-1 family phage major tail protein
MVQTPITGKDTLLFLRLLKNATQKAATKLALEVTHTYTKSRDTDSEATKDGSIPTGGVREDEFEAENFNPIDRTIPDLLEYAFDNDEILEGWMVYRQRIADGTNSYTYSHKNEDGTVQTGTVPKNWVFARYFRIKVTSYEEENGAEDLSDVSTEYQVVQNEVRGWLALPEENISELNVAFRGIQVWEEAENGQGWGRNEPSLIVDDSQVSDDVPYQTAPKDGSNTASTLDDVNENSDYSDSTSSVPTDANTVAEIKEYLDAQGIEYDSSATKADLLNLV